MPVHKHFSRGCVKVMSFGSSRGTVGADILWLGADILGGRFLFRNVPAEPSVKEPSRACKAGAELAAVDVQPSGIYRAATTADQTGVSVVIPSFFRGFYGQGSNVALFRFLVPLRFRSSFRVLHFNAIVRGAVMTSFLGA